jgi:NAD/NADP transhydrogenase alpha subunit
MKIFVPNQSGAGETRVALVPTTVKKLALPGVEIIVESLAGQLSSHGDNEYRAAGAAMSGSESWGLADIVLVQFWQVC